MIFAELPLDEAEGAILAYTTAVAGLNLRKGTMLSAMDIQALAKAGHRQVLAAKLQPGDIDENAAAQRIGRLLCGDNMRMGSPSAGRINLFAGKNSLFRADKDLIDQCNLLSPAISIATLPDHVRVDAEQMIATIKIIPFALAEPNLAAVEQLLRQRAALTAMAFQSLQIGIIHSRLTSTRDAMLDQMTALMHLRCAQTAGTIIREERVAHNVAALAAAIRQVSQQSDVLIIFGASAVCDERDILPAAITSVGGELIRIGVPVDPGNLLVVGHYQGKYVIGAPGSARQNQNTSLDWVLDRILAGETIDAASLARLGVGGLLLSGNK